MKKPTYFPPPELVGHYLHVAPDQISGPRKVLVSLAVLRKLIQLSIANLEFDADWYLNKYPDLKDAWKAGTLGDPHEHFIHQGYFEGRSPCENFQSSIDAEWYLATYRDVAEGLGRGEVVSAEAHYMAVGRKEGRAPNADLMQDIEEWTALFGPKKPG